MQLIGLARLGRDAELKYTAGGKAVANLSLAFNYGMRDPNTKEQPTQWIDASLWNERAEKLAQYLTKGKQVYVILTDPHIETYEKRDGSSGAKIVAMVNVIEFAGSAKQEGGQDSAPAQAAAPAKQKLPGNVQDVEDDIPF